MNNLWRRIGNWNRKSSSKSSSDENATHNMPQQLEPARDELVVLGNPAKRFDWKDVKGANWEVLRDGTVETTFKADLKDGTTTVVVKMLKDVVLSAEDFRDKFEALIAMDRENLLPLRVYMYSKDRMLILYDYMPLGSLSDQLHKGHDEWRRPSLSWEVRLSIALGAARAIEHLHAQDIHHGNIMSSNVLLTPSFEAQVADYGLPHLTKPDQKAKSDPSKADVYGFGVFLLELLTGRPSTGTHHNEVGNVVDLPAWVNYIVYSMGITGVLDAELLRPDNRGEKGAVVLLQVAISCVSPNPNERPPMSGVRKKIEELCSPGGQGDGDPQLDQLSQVNNDMSTWKPPDGILEVSERVYRTFFKCSILVS